MLRRDAHLAPTSDTGHREAQTFFENGYRGFGAAEIEQSLIKGGPGECIEYLEDMEQAGVIHVLFWCALDERELALQTIRVLGEHVIPISSGDVRQPLLRRRVGRIPLAKIESLRRSQPRTLGGNI